MGNWNISITGIGQHHNDLPEDADAMARRLVADLVDAGHQIDAAHFTCGGGDDLTPAALGDSGPPPDDDTSP